MRGLAAAALAAVPAMALAGSPAAELQIYFIDVEGGQSTLIVTPERETLLVDAGFAGEGTMSSDPGDPTKARDPGRIVAAMRDAGVDHIDYLLVTHFHRDHIGGIPEVAQLVPVGTFVDHGSAYPPEQRGNLQANELLDAAAYDRYLQTRARGRHLQPQPGDRLPLKGVDTVVVSADRATLRQPLPGAGGTNPACRPSPLTPPNPADENPRSTGIVMQFGRFRFLDIGDLNGQPLYDLVCPVNRVGAVDVYLVAHHGNSTVADPATLAAFQPRAAVVNNAPRKGGRLALLQMLRNAPQLESWQLHVSTEAGEGGKENAPAERIANLDEVSGHWLKVTARADGSFSLRNARTGAVRDYGERRTTLTAPARTAIRPATEQ